MTRYVTDDPEYDPRNRFGLYRLCECSACGGRGKYEAGTKRIVSESVLVPRLGWEKCSECRGEGRVRQELATCETPESVGVALVTLAREGEFEECPLGLLDREPPCETCHGYGEDLNPLEGIMVECFKCKGSGVKPTGTWLISPWLPSARNVHDAAVTLARSKKTRTVQ